ncbi:XRE family transcriptional regulator [Sporosarcina sp. BI001-red]|uniref:helix-turn-helix domain-containing protein n=1 Tax=Sporosarcina sp. BI001-red TaxID=2282866 RepID=UPI000E23ECAF|nr:XRE family transcriptional regulator [Sporosarcina sp. BI001-red]REB08568.1 XRE family transcriptional regulator [Sporosarcina sp. BI001-red]
MEEIHNRIKSLRVERNLTLKEMSDQTGLSLSFLSQIERGTSSLSISSLKKISDALGIHINYFFEEEQETQTFVMRADDHHSFTTTKGSQIYSRLTGTFNNRRLEPLKVTLPPRMHEEHPYSHSGEEFYYVLDGEVIFYLNNEKHHLYEGDTIHFPSSLIHQWENPLETESSVLSIVTPIIF